MSQENVDLVRSICTAWDQGDFTNVEWAHPEIEFVLSGGPADGTWTGIAGMAEGWRSWLGAWEDFRAEPDGYQALDGERVLVLLRGGARGKTSGMELGRVRSNAASLFHFRGDTVTRLVVYFDRERALADLGLSEQNPNADPDS